MRRRELELRGEGLRGSYSGAVGGEGTEEDSQVAMERARHADALSETFSEHARLLDFGESGPEASPIGPIRSVCHSPIPTAS